MEGQLFGQKLPHSKQKKTFFFEAASAAPYSYNQAVLT